MIFSYPVPQILGVIISTDPYKININNLEFHEELGSGEFGLVKQATLEKNGEQIEVTVKIPRG